VVDVRSVGFTDETGEWLGIDERIASVGLESFRNIFHITIGRQSRKTYLRVEMRVPDGVLSEGEIDVDFSLE
jgi:hypothetical protein